MKSVFNITFWGSVAGNMEALLTFRFNQYLKRLSRWELPSKSLRHILSKYLNSKQISSFDVFDTVLVRSVGTPRAIFLLLGKELTSIGLINCTPEAFAQARIRSEHLAHRNIGEYYSLKHIYTELALGLQLTDEQREAILERECILESKLIHPVPTARELIQAARNQGQHIVFTSDMYLPANFIQEQLVRHSFWAEGDVLYVSNEYGKSKATGELFRELITRENALPTKITHYGNDLRSDIQGGKKVGLNVQHFPQGNLNHYEQILESYSAATEGLASAMAGASRLVRLQIPVFSRKEEALRDVAAGVVAPTLVGYVLWILQQAQIMKLKRLYFVSRDGQVLLQIARKLVGRLNIDCELHYIYGSRLSWNMPALISLDQQQAFEMLKRPSWILDSTSTLSIRDFLGRVYLTPEDISDSLASVGFTAKDWSRVLTSNEQKALHPLIENSQVIRLIFNKAAQQQQVLIKYLEQIGILDSTPKGIVDVGWFGSSYDTLATVLKTRGITLDVGLFFGLKGSCQNHQDDAKKGYFFDQRTQTGFQHALPELGIVPLEMFCSGDHGTVVSFREEGEQVRPVLREEQNQRVIDWGLPLVRKAINCFAENLLLDPCLVNPEADMREATSAVLQSFWSTPSEVEANAWGDFPWEKGHSEKTDSLAKSYNWLHLAKSVLTGKLPDNQSLWFEGAIARSSPLIRQGIKILLRYLRLLSVIKSKIRRYFG